jgi:hypothetical protein
MREHILHKIPGSSAPIASRVVFNGIFVFGCPKSDDSYFCHYEAMKTIVSSKPKKKFLDDIDAAIRDKFLQTSADPSQTFTIITPEATYKSCTITEYAYSRKATQSNGLLLVELQLLEVRILESTTSGGPPASPAAESASPSLSTPSPQPTALPTSP